ncbi:MAG: virulence factor BrkB family protein [Xanthomonadaceae bacterium]|nr:virulence factor BrkB family protein [Xanthomonadaceae bacterium]
MHPTPSKFGVLADPRWLKAFGRHLWRHFRDDNCFEAAAALSYTSLLAIVPLMAVVLGVLSAFPVFEYGVDQLQDFIFFNFVPAAGDVIREYLNQVIERSGELTGTGTLFLVITAIILMSTIEKSLNRIWRVTQARQPANRLVVYWAALTLGPLLLGASLGLTSYVAALPLLAPEFAQSTLRSLLLLMTPFVVTLVAFTLVFMVVPNRNVRWHHALTGAFLSTLAFELSKRGFVVYVSNFPTYQKLYGAIAAIPIFLIWIFVSWVVILLGASLSAALTTFNYHRSKARWDPRHNLFLCLRVLGHLWRAQQQHGGGIPAKKLRDMETAATDDDLSDLFSGLIEAGFIHSDERGDWYLGADLAEHTLGDLYRSMRFVLPVGEKLELPEQGGPDQALIAAVHEISEVAGPLLDKPLKSFIKSGPSGPIT